ncbi:MAG: hypothetical protein WAZ40_03580 [Minisyncoccia bacterium]
MNFFAITNNFFDVQIIINISIGVILGITGANLLSEFISKILSRTLPALWKILISKFIPISLQIGVTTDFNIPYSTIINIPQVRSPQQNSPTNVYILIQHRQGFFSFIRKNKSTDIIVNWVDHLPGIEVRSPLRDAQIGDGTWRLFDNKLDPDRPLQIRLHVTKLTHDEIQNRMVKIVVIAGNRTIEQVITVNPLI